MAVNTRASGIAISETVKDSRDTQTEILILASSSTAKLMAKVYILGKTEKYTTANGTRVSNKAMAYGKECKMIHILASGALLRLMATEYTPGPMETGTRVSGKCASSMAMGQIPLSPEMCILESMWTESLKERENTLGLIIRYTQVNFIKDLNMEKVNGRVLRIL